MLYYGFCYPDNKFDSLELRLRIDKSIMENDLEELIDFNCKSYTYQKFYLKPNMIN